MRFKFPLQKVLEHRQTLEDLAQREFQETLAEQHRQEDLLRRMIEDLRDARQEAGRVQERGRDGAPETLKQIHEFSVLQDIRIKSQKAKVEEHAKLVEEKREILRLKAVDLKIMERLRERKLREFRKERERLEQAETDEINVLRFARKDGE